MSFHGEPGTRTPCPRCGEEVRVLLDVPKWCREWLWVCKRCAVELKERGQRLVPE